MKRSISLLGLLAIVAAALPAGASPTCPDEPRAACGGRVFPEAENSVSFVQHDNGEYEAGIKALERDFPRFVKVKQIGAYLDREVTSFGGRPIWVVEITDFEAPEDGKVPVAVSLSVHGPERAGLEGGVRYMEDLARWATDEPDHPVMNGTEPDSTTVPVGEALKKVHLYLSNINPDGWAAGDAANGGVFVRGNANGVDLNREFPTIGWSYPPYTSLSEPESKAWAQLMAKVRPSVSGDLHGELDSANNAFADIMIPAGQWNAREQSLEEAAARHMNSNIERYFEENGVEAGAASGVGGMKPAEYATGYDVVGYDAAGFMGDWFTQRFGAVDIDVEHFLSHMAPNSTWFAPLEEAHIMAVRAEIETLMVEAIARPPRPELRLGRVGYLKDGKVVTHRDGYGGPKPPKGVDPKGYRVSRLRFFRDLGRFTDKPVTALTSADLRSGRFDRLDTIVLADAPGPDAAAGKLRRWVRAGGNLVLTDKATLALAELGVVKRDAIHRRLYNAGHINIDDFTDAYTNKVHTTASQTYYEVPLGFSIDEDASPHWVVDASAWSGANGKAIAHVEDENDIGLGRVRLGRGRIGFIAGLLPQPTERFDHFYGLADYAVTVAGGQILNNMIKLGR